MFLPFILLLSAFPGMIPGMSLSNFLWLIPSGSFPPSNVHVSFGVGTPVAWQVKLTGSPSLTDWFTGDNKIWGDTENKKSTTDVQQSFSRYNEITTSNQAVIRCMNVGNLARPAQLSSKLQWQGQNSTPGATFPTLYKKCVGSLSSLSKKLECPSICQCHSKGSIFSSSI